MGTIPEQDPGPTIKCMICGRENPADRPYCFNCKRKLHDPAMDQLRASMEALLGEHLALQQEHASALDENQQLREQLEPVQTENQQLREVIEPLKDELANLKATSANPENVAALTTSLQAAKDEAATAKDEAATLASHAETLKDRWQSAEAKAAALEANLKAKAKELEDFIKKHSGTNPIPYLKSIVAFITLLGSLAGYGTGRYVQPKGDAGDKVKQLVTQVGDAQRQIENLRSSLNSANDKNAKADQVQNQSQADLNSANQKATELSAHQQQLQHQLTEANTQKAAANQTVVQLNAEIAKLHAQPATKGSLVWSGNLITKHRVEIKNGVPNFGDLNGALPPKLCKVSTQDGRVKIKNRPSKSHLNDLSFDVSGLGLVQVRIDWEISQ